MKIAISATEPDVNAAVDPRFGRAHSFMIHDTADGSWQPVENTPNLNAAQGAGIQTAEMIANSGVEAVITGHCGPKAFRVLAAGGIKVYNGASGTVLEALEAFNENKLTPASGPDVEGHWQ